MKRVLLPLSAPNYAVDQATGDIRVRPREKLLERLPATASRNAAFDLLHERLAVATEFFQHHGDGGRYGVYRAMGDLIEYLTSRGIPHATIRPIEAVMAAIVDADNGAGSHIFEPSRTAKGGSPPKSVMQLEFEGKLAIVIECCVRHCRAEGKRPFVEPAARLAAKLINESTWPVHVTARDLVELRERVQQRKKGFSPDRMEVDQSMSSEVARSNPLDWAKILLAHEWVNPLPKVSE
ncbi:MAG: hypothetical protein ABL914_09300 [Novosphingobium sp.]|uniref:hypothetical protein n=1 Tax=Novosphingobium sp. TaxID=1874826 RepID=UPI0032BD4CDC